MSRENVELLQALIPQPDVDIAPLFRDEHTFARQVKAVRAFLTEDFESVMVFPARTQTYPGWEGFRKNWLDWLQPWATYRTTIEELIDLGERVVVLVRNHGRRHGGRGRTHRRRDRDVQKRKGGAVGGLG